MLLRNARLWREEGLQDIIADNGSILAVQQAGVFSKPLKDAVSADLDGALVVPGFINSHDHLDFNNYPSLAHGNYPDYRAWGADIHHRYAPVISAVKQIPQELRVRWGLYKNLLNGFTTVVIPRARTSSTR